MKFRFTVLFSLFVVLQLAIAQTPIQSKINDFTNNPNLKTAGVSIAVLDVADNTLVAGYNAHQSLIPASSLKVVTTASALGILGADYKWETYLEYDGVIENGVLKGNLYIVGSGDPTFGNVNDTWDEHLQAFVVACKEAGILSIEGDIVADASWVDDSPTPWSWQYNDIGNYYGAGVYGLNYLENTYQLFFQQNSTLHATPQISHTTPNIPNLSFTNEVKNAPARTGDNAYIFGNPGSYDRVVRGTIPVGNKLFKIKGSIPNPPLLAAQALRNQFNLNYMSATGTRVSTAKEKTFRTRIHTHYSRPLKEIVAETNDRSMNLFAEAMLKTIGYKSAGKASRNAGIDAIKTYWRDRGIDMTGFFLEDGSGLSARNAVTSYQIAQIIRKTHKDTRLQSVFFANRSTTGSLKLFKQTAKGTVYAKSGTLKRARSYSGYILYNDGRVYTFSIIVNNFEGSGSKMRRAISSLMTEMGS